MRLNCKALRRFPKAVQPGFYGICVAILITSAFQPLHAADNNDRPEAHVLSGSKTGDGRARVLLNEKPLFGSQSTIPSVTPDGSGRTKVKVIVKPSAPSTKRAGSERASQEKAPRPDLRSPYESLAKVEQKRAKDMFSRAMKEEVRPAYRPSRAQASEVLLPTPKPGARSGHRTRTVTAIDNDNRKTQAHPKFGSLERSRRRARRRPSARRADYRRAWHPRKRWQRRRARRIARWRRNAPPGTVNSFVRCWPGEPCIWYYRVRRPRTLHQYRRLMAWQRRQDARLRYRRYYRRY